jgi:tellurite resistance protein TerC
MNSALTGLLCRAPNVLLSLLAQQVEKAGESRAASEAAPALGGSPLLWSLFFAVVLSLLFVDLFLLHPKDRPPQIRRATLSGLGWIAIALLFCAGVAWRLGARPAQEFLTGYVVELSLSFDNLFVFVILFRFFAVEREHQHRVLFWGILGALVLRGVFIVAGTALLARFDWLVYLFGFFLLFTGVKLFRGESAKFDPGRSAALRLARRVVPVTASAHGGRFFVREEGRLAATTLFLCLVSVEASDVVFAVDSIPAIFGVTLDPFVVYTSNVFAILGLRSFFVLLAVLMAAFRHLHYGLAFVLTFIGVKMLLPVFDVHVSTGVSLGVVLGSLAVAVLASLRRPRGSGTEPGREEEGPTASSGA